jgi:hypothetical protein
VFFSSGFAALTSARFAAVKSINPVRGFLGRLGSTGFLTFAAFFAGFSAFSFLLVAGFSAFGLDVARGALSSVRGFLTVSGDGVLTWTLGAPWRGPSWPSSSWEVSEGNGCAAYF